MVISIEELKDVARRAGALALSMQGTVEAQAKDVDEPDAYYRRQKSAFSEADGKVQELILTLLAKNHAGRFGIITEEDVKDATSFTHMNRFVDDGFTLIIDPIDGSANYLGAHHSWWGVSLCLAKGTTPVSGVIFYPALDVMLSVTDDETFIDGKRVRVDDGASFHESDFVRVSGALGTQTAKIRSCLGQRAPEHTGSFVVTFLSLFGVAALPLCRAYIGGGLPVHDIGCSALAWRKAGGLVLDMRAQDIEPFSSWYTDVDCVRQKEMFMYAPSKRYATEFVDHIRSALD
ncbi:MAG: inositol monophosphatase family protein [Nanoarchaeota archaeon]